MRAAKTKVCAQELQRHGKAKASKPVTKELNKTLKLAKEHAGRMCVGLLLLVWWHVRWARRVA